MAAVERTYYDILGVGEEARGEELIKAYRQKALENHPDKGGDANLFDELAKAFRTLDVSASREAYDTELARARERALLVEGGPAGNPTGNFSKQQSQAPMPRQKTEPTAGSKRQGKMRTAQPGGKPQCCALEWKGMSSGAAMLKMLCDDVSEKQKTQALFDKYSSLPRGKEKQREWLSGVRGDDKQNLKKLAKQKEAEQKAKWQKWLQNGPTANGPTRK